MSGQDKVSSRKPELNRDQSAILKSAQNKAAIRLIPLLGLGYLFNYIDRTNIGFAALEMNADLGLTATTFGFAAGIFYLGYCLCEVPSNLALVRYGARRWLARIMVSWGLLSALTAAAVGPNSFYLIRFLAGIAEAGFYPGVIFFLTTWFPAAARARIFSWFIVAIPLSSVISGPLSTSLLSLDGIGGLHGWQWMFIIEGLPAAVLGFICYRFLVDRPEDAAWLTPEEKTALRSALDREQASKALQAHRLWDVLVDPRVLLLSASYFCFLVGVLGITIWLPQILQGAGLSTMEIGLMSSLPYIGACVAMVVAAGAIDRSRRYVRAYAVGCLVGAAGFAVSVISGSLIWAMLGIAIALAGMNGARPAFFSIPPLFLHGTAAAAGIAMINSVGNMGGFVGPYLMGWLRDQTGSYVAGLLGLSVMLVLSALFVCAVRVERKPDR
ncbi:MAG: MFS transporter [Alphaproteobacteria bacterium HGW-Alphaproteobacteria-5]|jgi:MFS family permease|nr:MAG: MFS transporter [Alphaproteobacteria bacterium HGW-Alphaproteobacteria-5]